MKANKPARGEEFYPELETLAAAMQLF